MFYFLCFSTNGRHLECHRLFSKVALLARVNGLEARGKEAPYTPVSLRPRKQVTDSGYGGSSCDAMRAIARLAFSVLVPATKAAAHLATSGWQNIDFHERYLEYSSRPNMTTPQPRHTIKALNNQTIILTERTRDLYPHPREGQWRYATLVSICDGTYIGDLEACFRTLDGRR